MRYIYLTLIAVLFHAVPKAQNTSIDVVQIVNEPTRPFEKVEFRVFLTGMYSNPYDYDQVHLFGEFFSPDGKKKTVDGFYMQDYELNTSNGSLTPILSGEFRIRFAPDIAGEWNIRLHLETQSGIDFLDLTPIVVPDASQMSKGYIRKGDDRYLKFDDGDQYIPVGQNVAWQNGNIYVDYNRWLTEMSDHDANFIRLWHSHWGVGLEWQNGQGLYKGLRRYHPSNTFFHDWIMETCEEKDINVMLCLQHHGQVSSGVNPNWNESPYNTANGGPCANTWEFFTNEEAKAHVKNRLRYVVARWGYSTSIMCWELFNEVIWTDDFQNQKPQIAAWHKEMAAFLNQIDPYDHLVTTSYGDSKEDEELWSDTLIDFTQTHTYINIANIERALANNTKAHLEDFDKPTLNGEFGLGTNENLNLIDPDGIHIHNSMWGTLFGGALGAAMTWWWDNYIHPRDLYFHFAPISIVAKKIPFLTAHMRPVDVEVLGVPGNLSISPVLGWGGIGTSVITIQNSGTIDPANATLASFLYGAQWNTQFRSPPSFNVTYPQAGSFTVRTGSEMGTAPTIQISVDGNVVLSQAGAVNTSYTVPVTQGTHVIKVDNVGTDWIIIDSYQFSESGSKLDAYVLKSESNDILAGWVLSNEYNHRNVLENGEPQIVTGGVLKFENVKSGEYDIEWMNCLTGEVENLTIEQTQNGNLNIALPDVAWDRAFKAKHKDLVSIVEIEKSYRTQIQNPLTPGSECRIFLKEGSVQMLEVIAMDNTGKTIFNQIIDPAQMKIFIPPSITPGIYYFQIKSDSFEETHPVVIQ